MGKDDGTNLPEQATATTSAKVDVHVVVLTADWFLHKRFFQEFPVNDDGITILAHGYLWSDTEIAKLDAEFVHHELLELGIEAGTAVSRNLQTSWGWDVKMVQNSTDKTAVPEEGLGGEIVDAKGAAELDIRDGLVEGKVCGKKGDENVATGPIFDV